MNAVKISFVVAASVFCFALGITFHASLTDDEAGRELASARRARPAVARPLDPERARLSLALRACASEPAKSDQIELSKAKVDKREMSMVSLNCSGERARSLYNAVAPYSSEQFKAYHNGSTGVVRFFGRLYPPSQCARLVSKPHQAEANEYSCTLQIDLDQNIVSNLSL